MKKLSDVFSLRPTNFAGANPNLDRLTVAGTFVDAFAEAVVFPELIYDPSATEAWVDAPSLGATPDYSIYRNAGTWYALGPSGPIFSSSDTEDNPAEVTGWANIGAATGAGTMVVTAIPLTASFLGQLCKTSTAWWIWNGTAWVPFMTLDGSPIAYNSTLSSYRKLTVSGADGSETITISAL